MSIKSNFWVIVFVVILFSLFVWPQATARASLPIIEVSGNITTDTTWTSSNIYVITGHLTIDEHITLTIHQGTIVKFDGNKLMAVNGKLIVQGTPSNPVYITSLKDDTLGGDTNGDGVASSPQPGDWGHINFRDSSTDAENLIENTVIQYGGYFNAYHYEYYDCYNCAYHGVLRFEGSSPTIRNNTLQNNVGYALTGDVNSYPVVSNNTILENGGNGLEIRGGTFSNDLPVVRYWHNTDIVYAITGHITIPTGITLVVDPGVIIKVSSNKLMAVNGKLIVQGTPSNPVYITSLKDDTLGGDTNGDGVASSPQPGDWGHINFRDPSVDVENLIENTVIQYGGYFNAYHYEYYDCYNCAYHGVLRFEGSSPTIRNNTLQNNVGYALTGDVNSYPVVSNNTILENGGNGLEIRGGTFSNDLPVVRYWHNTDIVYAITGHITIPTGITLVVDPGVIIKVSSNQLIGVNGVLKTAGTPSNPINFTSLKDDTLGGDTNGDGVASSPQPGDWGHINFRDPSVDVENLIENTVIQYGGYFNAYHYEYYDCYNCAYHGVLRFEGSSPTIRNNTLQNNVGYALTGDVNSYPVVSNNTILENGGNGLEIRGGTFSNDLPVVRYWHNTDIVYAITGHITIPTGITLVVDPGVIIKVSSNQLIGVNGVLKLGVPITTQASAAFENDLLFIPDAAFHIYLPLVFTLPRPVYITSLKDDTLGGDTNGDGVASSPQPGDWGHINFRDSSTDAENLIENTVIQYGGYFNAYHYEYYDCYNCAYHGVLRFEGSSPTIRNNTLQNNVGYALTGDVNSYPVVSNNTILENGGNGLEIRGGTFSNDLPVVRYWHNTDIVYAITGHITIPTGITLVVDPGVIIKVSSNKLIGVNGVLKTTGSPSNPVYITSLKDDTLGGDTNGDGVASSPQPGDWGHINFRDSSTDAENLIENTVIQYGGYFNAYNYEYYDCYDCTYNGVLRFEGSSPTIQGNRIRYNNYGLITTNGALPLVTNNAIYSNEVYGFYNEDPGVVVKAENNWWGSVSGPYHSSNPGGSGNQVSDNIDFNPWLSSSPVALMN